MSLLIPRVCPEPSPPRYAILSVFRSWLPMEQSKKASTSETSHHTVRHSSMASGTESLAFDI